MSITNITTTISVGQEITVVQSSYWKSDEILEKKVQQARMWQY